MSDAVKKILSGENVRETILEEVDLLEMANVLGKYVKTDHVDFSFYFSDKYGMKHGIRVKIKWNPVKFTKPEDGYMELHGDYSYVRSTDGAYASSRDIEQARQFFKKYKVLFAAVWEEVIDQSELQMFFTGNLSFKDLLSSLGVPETIENLQELEQYVRKNNLFNMND